jgi:hypothetical protein
MARWPVKLVTELSSTWSKLFKANLESLPWTNKKKNRPLGYSFLDKIIFGAPSGFGKLQYTKSIWTAWSELRKLLEYNIRGNKIPSYWSIEDAIKISPSANEYSEDQKARIVSFFGKIQVTTVKDLWNIRLNTWKNFDNKLERTRGLPDWVFWAIKRILEDFHQAT